MLKNGSGVAVEARRYFTMKRTLLVVTFAMLVMACSTVGNNERAYFESYGAKYLVKLKGTRRLMAHDPFSAIRGRTYEETLTLELPRIEGTIEGSEIPVPAGKLRYAGRIAITNGKMNLDLYYDHPDSQSKDPLLWNGDYNLVKKEINPTR